MAVCLKRDRLISDIVNWNCAAPEYSDRSLYVRDLAEPYYREWEFTVTLERETGLIYDGPVRLSTVQDGPYEETTETPPEAIRALFLQRRPELVSQLEAEKAAPRPAIHEYAFDCTLVCAIRVKAATPEAAAELVRAQIDGAEAHLGVWPSGAPILCEVSVEGSLDLFQVDGADKADCDPY